MLHSHYGKYTLESHTVMGKMVIPVIMLYYPGKSGHFYGVVVKENYFISRRMHCKIDL